MAGRPEGYPSVSPYVTGSGIARVIAFLEQTFDATLLRRFDRPDGSLMHGEVRMDDSVVMLAEATESWPAVPTHLHVYVADVDATWQRAVAAGGTVVREPARKEGDTDKRGGIQDPAGNTWWIATQVS